MPTSFECNPIRKQIELALYLLSSKAKPEQPSVIRLTTNPYLEKYPAMLELEYEDKSTLWFDLQFKTPKLIMFAVNAPVIDKKITKAIPVKELRSTAKVLVHKLTDFTVNLNELSPQEDYGRDKSVYYFRWNDLKTKVNDAELQPFVQVAFTADERFISYTNTLR